MISPEIERKIGAALNVQHILAPAEEDFSIFLMPRYKEIIKTEKDILNFVSELIDLLQDESFKVIFARNPEALELITNILKVAQEIQVDQKAILVSLEGNSNSSAELISRIEQACRHCDQKNYQEMAFLIDSFDKIMKRERYRDAVKIFGTSKVNALKKIETPLSLIANTLFPFLENLSLDTRFSTQLILRRQMTYQTFIQSFTEKHANIGALETLYNGLFATNRAINRMQTIEAARVGFEGICFQLVTKVFDLLTESKPSFLKEDDLNKIMEKRKAIIIAYLKRLEQKVLKGISTEVIVFERTAVSDVIMAINSNTTTPQDIVVAVTGLLNALPHNFRNVDLADQWEDIPTGQEDFDEWEMIDEDKKEKIVEKSNLSMGVASSGSPNFFRSFASGTVPTPDAAQSSAEKSNEKKPMPINNGTPLVDEMARSKLFQTRMDRT
ncbi:MAG: hypothetical protein K2Q33_01475 [Gammaproteobacteria bacterium]|nr:hypothetical protein [Gammaproteobacteria bacterium]